MTTWLLVLLVCGAAARLTRLVTADAFPPIARARSWLSARGDWQDYLLHCPWCSGVWVAGAVTAVVTAWYGLPAPLLVWATAAWVSGWLGAVETHDVEDAG